MVKNLPANAGDLDLIPEWGISPGGEKGNPLQCPCLGNPMDRGAWWSSEILNTEIFKSEYLILHPNILLSSYVTLGSSFSPVSPTWGLGRLVLF